MTEDQGKKKASKRLSDAEAAVFRQIDSPLPESMLEEEKAMQQRMEQFFAEPQYNPVNVFDTLNGKRFSSEQLCHAANISIKTLTNWLHLHKLVLVSANPGKGRARQYCLLDVYILAILRELVQITNAPRACSDIVWMQVVEPMLTYRLPEDLREDKREELFNQELGEYFDDLCMDLRSGAAWMYDRQDFAGYFLVLTPNREDGGYSAFYDPNPQWGLLRNEPSVSLLNLTVVCKDVDWRLYDAMVGHSA